MLKNGMLLGVVVVALAVDEVLKTDEEDDDDDDDGVVSNMDATRDASPLTREATIAVISSSTSPSEQSSLNC